MTPTSSAEQRVVDHEQRLRNLEIAHASMEKELQYVLEALRQQVHINDRQDNTNKELPKSRYTLWGYAIGFVGMLVVIIDLVWRLK